MKQVIRILGGMYKGKKLDFPEVPGLRPTPNRVRETLFNWLMHDIRGANCVDAFAGSGALGLEAFSRGAAHVTFLEQSPTVHTHLSLLLRQFNSPQLELLHTNALQYLHHCAQHVDVIFLDPPFAHDLIPACLDALWSNSHFHANGLVYVESPKAVAVDENKWQQLKLKQAGQVLYGLYKKVD